MNQETRFAMVRLCSRCKREFRPRGVLEFRCGRCPSGGSSTPAVCASRRPRVGGPGQTALVVV